MNDFPKPYLDPGLGQFVCDTPNGEVFGNTYSECARKRAEALGRISKHAQVNGNEMELLHISQHSEHDIMNALRPIALEQARKERTKEARC